jgi:hypothetical protein
LKISRLLDEGGDPDAGFRDVCGKASTVLLGGKISKLFIQIVH